MNNILFVDDESKVLEALRRMLRDQRHAWHMEFAVSGQEALSRFEARAFDVVVSDMRMPGMDGAQLLEEIRGLSPQTVRIILSGQSDRDSVLRSIGPTHQFLAKPCDPDRLKATVARACGLRDRLADDRLIRLVSRIHALPSVPSVCARLFDELRSSNISLMRLGEIISQDIAMTAKVLQLVNSGYFGLPRKVSSPIQAVTLLGVDTIKALALSLGIFSPFDSNVACRESLNEVVDHSLRVAMSAKAICHLHSPERTLADDAFLTGALHDIGQLVMIADLSSDDVTSPEHAQADALPTWRIEETLLGETHCDLGAYLMSLWGLPDSIVDAATFHHNPSLSVGDQFSALTAVHVADVLVHELTAADQAPSFDWEYLNRVGVADCIEGWRETLCGPSTESMT